VQAGCGETCDNGPANGTNQCCSASCTLVDGDDDALCDAIDPCTGGVPLAATSIRIGRQRTPPGDDSLSWRGELVLPFPFTPPLDPATRGVRILLAHGTTVVLDAVIPGGPPAGSPPVGWKTIGNGSRWYWTDRNRTPATRISRVQVQQVTGTPGRLKVRIMGKKASLPSLPGNPPLAAVLVLDPPVAMTGQCGEALLPCTAIGAGASRRCE
jgi:hypothetical protein